MKVSMRIDLQREQVLKDGTTIGSMYLNDKLFCRTLEDPIRDLGIEDKVYGDTAIPAGTYRIIVNYSQKFRRVMPLLLNVPKFKGIRIHSGVTKAHTLGCILIGMKVHENTLKNSHTAYNWFFPNLRQWLTQGKVLIKIINPLPVMTTESKTSILTSP